MSHILLLFCLLFLACLIYLLMKNFYKNRLIKFLSIPIVLFCLFLVQNPVSHFTNKALFSTNTAEELLMEDPENRIFFLILKDKFPQDYAQIIAQAEDFIKTKNPKQDIHLYISNIMNIVLRKLPYADDDSLIAMIQKDMQLHTELLNENNTTNCFYFDRPHLAPDISLFSQQMKPYLDSMRQAKIRALQSANIHRRIPNENEVVETQDKVNQILRMKYSEQELQQLTSLIYNDNKDEMKQYTPEEQASICRFTIDVTQALLDQPKHKAAELIRFNLSH